MTEYDQAVGQLRLISAAIDQGELDGARTPLVFATVAVNAMQAEIARLRAALEKIEAKPWSPGADCGVGDCVDIARAALDGWELTRKPHEVPLTQGMVALVDEEDYARVTAVGPWSAERVHRCYYASTYVTGERVRMHRFLLDAKPGQEVDHVNRDALDNRKANLRLATNSQQAANVRKRTSSTSSRFKGVSHVIRPDRSDRWRAQISRDGRRISLGYFETEAEAVAAYDAAAKATWGDFANSSEADR